MKIAIFSPSWPPGSSPNGIVTYVSQIVPLLRELGHEVFVLTPRAHGHFEDRYLIDLMKTHPNFSLLRAFKKRLMPRQSIHIDMAERLITAVRQLKRHESLDLIEIEESFGWSYRLSLSNLVPVVVRLHGPWFLNGAMEGQSSEEFAGRVAAEKRAIGACTLVTAPSADVLERVRQHYGFALREARVIPNPVDRPSGDEVWSLEECDKNKLLYVGRFDERKGGDVVLKAFAELAERNDRLTLTFVGPDLGIVQNGQRLHLQEFVHRTLPQSCWSRIKYAGTLQRNEIAKLRRTHFLTVVASKFEILPYAVLEAMSSGSPIVSTSVGGIPELIENGKNGLLYDSGNVAELVAQCRRLLDSPNLAAGLGAAARTFCNRTLNSNQIVAETLQGYSAAIKLHNVRRQ